MTNHYISFAFLQVKT